MKVVMYGIFALLLLVVPGRGSVFAADDAGQSMQGQASDDLFDDLYADDEVETADPLESVNRGVFWFNDKLYVYLLKPVAKGFRIVPQPVRTGVANMFDNLKSPLRAINSLLQLKFTQAATETGRLLVNSTVGLAGFYDPAKNYWGLKKKDEDFGQTLGYYGVGKGCYLVLPLFGASTIRDGVAMIPDGYADPLYWTVANDVLWGLRGVNIVNRVSLDKDSYESIVEEQLDPYLFIRDAYLQNRQAKVAD